MEIKWSSFCQTLTFKPYIPNNWCGRVVVVLGICACAFIIRYLKNLILSNSQPDPIKKGRTSISSSNTGGVGSLSMPASSTQTLPGDSKSSNLPPVSSISPPSSSGGKPIYKNIRYLVDKGKLYSLDGCEKNPTNDSLGLSMWGPLLKLDEMGVRYIFAHGVVGRLDGQFSENDFLSLSKLVDKIKEENDPNKKFVVIWLYQLGRNNKPLVGIDPFIDELTKGVPKDIKIFICQSGSLANAQTFQDLGCSFSTLKLKLNTLLIS